MISSTSKDLLIIVVKVLCSLNFKFGCRIASLLFYIISLIYNVKVLMIHNTKLVVIRHLNVNLLVI